MTPGRSWFQPDDWFDEGVQVRRRKAGETVYCLGYQPAKFPAKKYS
jgi:hypothetical protein